MKKTQGVEFMLLSIVVPFYNSMPYMKNLVESLINNSISAFRQEVEIIFVNDGSTDDYHEALKVWTKYSILK